MADAESYPVTDEHCLAFSAIVPHFARHERLMEIAIASLLRSTVGPTSIAVAGLGFTGKRDALKSLIKLSTLPDETATNIYSFLDKLQTRAALRNAIAHNVWRGGKRKGSIKPLGATARGGSGKIWGIRENEPSYTATELLKIASELALLYNSFLTYLQSIGLVSASARH